MKIYLIRHGESIANTQSIYQGISYDTPLSELGIKQAKLLAQRFIDIPITKIIASPLKRTLMTAQPVADFKKITIQPEKSIMETNHGEWEGKHKDIVVKSWPNIYRKWQKFPSGVKFPKGEHFLETQKRVIKWWENILKSEANDLLIVTHDAILRILIARVLNMKLNRIWRFHLQTTSVSEVEHINGQVKLKYMNEASHLGELQTNLANHAL